MVQGSYLSKRGYVLRKEHLSNDVIAELKKKLGELWKSDTDCENQKDPIMGGPDELIPVGSGFKLEADNNPEYNGVNCYDVETLLGMKESGAELKSPLTRKPFHDVDKQRITYYKYSDTKKQRDLEKQRQQHPLPTPHNTQQEQVMPPLPPSTGGKRKTKKRTKNKQKTKRRNRG